MSKPDLFHPREGFVRSFLSLFFLIGVLFVSCQKEAETNGDRSVFTFQPSKVYYQAQLDSVLFYLESLRGHIVAKDIKNCWINFNLSRQHFKKIEWILASVEMESYETLNAPNLLKVIEEDATDIKVSAPFGYQVIEEELDHSLDNNQNLLDAVDKTLSRIKLIKDNTQLNHLQDYHLLWMIRDQLIRTATLGITGFDSPVQNQSTLEAQWALEGIRTNIVFYKKRFKDQTLFQQINDQIQQTQQKLKQDFNSFDRFAYWKLDLKEQLNWWNQWVKDWNIEFPFELALKNQFQYFSSDSSFNSAFFGDPQQASLDSIKINLGKALFNDTRLSHSEKMSCATCHQVKRAFADTFAIRPGISRNAPTLLYSALQKGFFHDRRAGSLEDQVVGVFKSHSEFNTTEEEILAKVMADSSYLQAFQLAYHRSPSSMLIRSSLARFIKSLAPFSSRFDKALKNQVDLSKDEISGFNLFMSKAACATCHFPPLFNGTVPPYYRESELENIGTPEPGTDSTQISSDLGRYQHWHTSERKHFFKTPTLRNISQTAPYMHNGVYKTLEEVIEFYNNGGGIGLGFDNPLQTLPADSLKLSLVEMQQLIDFLHTLDDL